MQAEEGRFSTRFWLVFQEVDLAKDAVDVAVFHWRSIAAVL